MLTQVLPSRVKNSGRKMQSNENTALSGGKQDTIVNSLSVPNHWLPPLAKISTHLAIIEEALAKYRKGNKLHFSIKAVV